MITAPSLAMFANDECRCRKNSLCSMYRPENKQKSLSPEDNADYEELFTAAGYGNLGAESVTQYQRFAA